MLDRPDLATELLDDINDGSKPIVLRLIKVQMLNQTLTMEAMPAMKHIEGLAEQFSVAEFTGLRRLDFDELVLCSSVLLSEILGVFALLGEFVLEEFDLFVIIVEGFAKFIFELDNFRVSEILEYIVDFEQA